MKIITTEELKKKLDNDEVVLIDVLSEKSYEKSHISGAVNIPVKVVGFRAKEKYDKDEQVVVYCSGPDCQSSQVAAEKLEALGFNNVYRYKGGKKEWEEAGFPMD